MAERNLDFDKIIERRGTGSLKYDFAAKRGKPADVLPFWVADMDFQTSSYVLDAISERVVHGIFGYSEAEDSYFDAVASWMKNHHDWEVEKRWLVKTPGVVFGLAAAVRAYTNVGDAVLIQQPVYYPFSEVIVDNGRKLISNDLVYKNGKYEIDFEDFEAKVVENGVKLFLLCSPHNPVGRVWTLEELSRIGDICLKYGVTVVSDEIHHDFVYPGHTHHVFANVSPELADITITCTAPSKTFNLAGLQVSNIFIKNPNLRRAFRKEVAAAGYSQLNSLGLVACEAAYAKGEEWYDALLEYLEGNIDFLESYLEENIPQIKLVRTEGTYLAWLDFTALGLTEKQREHLLLHEAKLWLDSGAMFGAVGEGFERINVACPRSVLAEALERLKGNV